MARRGRLAAAATGFALAAAFASWNPLAAPFGLAVGIAAGVLSLRAMRRGERRLLAATGLAVSLLAVAASALVLALTAGVGRDPAGDPVVAGPKREEAQRQLGEAGERTRAARERAQEELSGVEEGASPAERRRGSGGQ
jgi:hypothetical protein